MEAFGTEVFYRAVLATASRQAAMIAQGFEGSGGVRSARSNKKARRR
jgi:hypothetical protein